MLFRFSKGLDPYPKDGTKLEGSSVVACNCLYDRGCPNKVVRRDATK